METSPLLSDSQRRQGENGNARDSLSTHAHQHDNESLCNGVSGQDDQSPTRPSLRARLQMPLLCYARMMEPLAYDSVFPYIARMTQHNGNLPASDVGFYSGLFESLFAGVEVLVVIFWGSMADRVGHKKMLVCALTGLSLGPALFGFSTSLWHMAFFRCLTGAFSGTNVIVRAMLMLRSTPENRARVFGWYTFADNMSLFIGPFIGGALADPVRQYPSLFKGIALLEKFPYALPGLLVACICASGALTTLVFIDEIPTQPTTQTDNEEADATPREGEATPKNSSSFMRVVKAPGFMTLLTTMMYVKVLIISMLAIMTTMLPTPVVLGGMGYSERDMAAFILVAGIIEGGWMLVVFPLLHRRIGTRGILYLTTGLFVLLFINFPAANELLRNGSSAARAWYWVALVGLVLLSTSVFMGEISGQVALQSLSPDSRSVGTLNAVAESCTSLVKTIVPAVATTIFAVGVRNQLAGGHLVWLVLILLCPWLLILIRRLPQGI